MKLASKISAKQAIESMEAQKAADKAERKELKHSLKMPEEVTVESDQSKIVKAINKAVLKNEEKTIMKESHHHVHNTFMDSLKAISQMPVHNGLSHATSAGIELAHAMLQKTTTMSNEVAKLMSKMGSNVTVKGLKENGLLDEDDD